MPTEPTSSSHRRPDLSIKEIAISVVTTLTTLVITVISSEPLALKPTACQSTLE
jgi:hypothetical protein